jgi:hypothetical protein
MRSPAVRKRDLANAAISISVNGGKEVSLTGAEFDQLPRMISGRKIGPMTKAQSDAAALVSTVVRRALGVK